MRLRPLPQFKTRCVRLTWLVLRHPAEGVPLILSAQVPAELLTEGTEVCDLYGAAEPGQLVSRHVRDPVKVLTETELYFLLLYSISSSIHVATYLVLWWQLLGKLLQVADGDGELVLSAGELQRRRSHRVAVRRHRVSTATTHNTNTAAVAPAVTQFLFISGLLFIKSFRSCSQSGAILLEPVGCDD